MRSVVNRGGDADTIGALAGQLAGACYGVQSIPAAWLRRLDPKVQTNVREQTAGLVAMALARSGEDSALAIRTWIVASREFQDDPRPIEIDGVRPADRRLFDRLAAIGDPSERGEVFHDYVSVKFRLHEWSEHQAGARSSLRSSYLRFLRHWGADSNSHAGAVLKAWVESRFGLPATFHHGRLETNPEARARYRYDCMRGAAQTVGAMMQLDLLYTFCQDELVRRFPGERWRTLYRGTHDPEEYALRPAEDAAPRTACVQLNNLSSFTGDRETAWEFGSSVWEVQVPLQKIVFFSGLLPRHLLEGESEYIVLGGEYRVRPLLY